MSTEELKKIQGGATTSGNFINSIVKLFNAFLEIGRSIGSALNYVKNKTTC